MYASATLGEVSGNLNFSKDARTNFVESSDCKIRFWGNKTLSSVIFSGEKEIIKPMSGRLECGRAV